MKFRTGILINPKNIRYETNYLLSFQFLHTGAKAFDAETQKFQFLNIFKLEINYLSREHSDKMQIDG
jgi:hypothetical protein